MAKERQTNININYKVNTVDIEKGNALLGRASQATDNLTKAIEKVSQNSTKSFGTSAKSIDDMRIRSVELKKIIDTLPLTATKRLSQYSAEYKKLQAEIKKTTAALYEQEKAQKQTNASLGQVITAVRTFIGLQIAREVISIQLAMARLSGQVEGVEKAFNRLPGATVLLHDLRQATRGTVTDLELMQKALMAQNYKIPLQNLSTLLEFAAVKAQQTGQEVNHLVDFIVTGIGLRSIKRLDDLGFTANRVKEALGGITLQAADMGQVMDAVTKLMNEDLQKTGGYVETSATQVAQLETAIHELNVEASKAATSSGLIQFFTDVVDLTRKAIKAGLDYKDVLLLLSMNFAELGKRKAQQIQEIELQEEINRLAAEQVSVFQRKNRTLEEGNRILDVDKQLFNLAKTLELYKKEDAASKNKIANLKKELEVQTDFFTGDVTKAGPIRKEIETIEANSKARQNNSRIVEEAIKLTVEYRDSLVDTVGTEKEIIGLVKAKRQEIEALNEAIEETNRRGDLGASGTLIKSLEKAEEELKELLGTTKKETIKNANEVQDYLSYLAELEMFQVREVLKAKREQREEEVEGEKRRAEMLTELWDDYEKDRLEKEREAAQLRKEIFQEGVDVLSGFLSDLAEIEASNIDARINKTRDFYDKQIELAGDNEKAKKELRIKEERDLDQLRRRQFQKEKEAQRAKVVINTAASIAKTAAELGFPAAIPFIILAAAQGAAQLIAINNATPRFAKGVIDLKGPGTKTSDSIPSLLSKGESVMTADETASSKGIFTAVRARKLNDKVLREIISGRSGGSVIQKQDYTPILKKLDEVKDAQPDLVEQGGLLYKSYQRGSNLRRRIRAKSMGS